MNQEDVNKARGYHTVTFIFYDYKSTRHSVFSMMLLFYQSMSPLPSQTYVSNSVALTSHISVKPLCPPTQMDKQI